MLRKIISGGQTGADRAGLDFAIETGLQHGGYVPRSRKAEDGRIADRYNLVELGTSSYPARNRKNIEESDGTVIFTPLCRVKWQFSARSRQIRSLTCMPHKSLRICEACRLDAFLRTIYTICFSLMKLGFANIFGRQVVLVVVCFLCTFAASARVTTGITRARDLGVPFEGTPGELNAITDVHGVEV